VIISVLWVVCGYAMAFGPSVLGGWFGWRGDYVLLSGLDSRILDSGIPEYVFAMFQGKFAIITPALIAGAFAERVRFRGFCCFILLWSIFVYNPLCHWVWAEDGFLFNLGAAGAIDFAGGTVVHISAGVTGLVGALYLGARRGYPQSAMHPSNLVMTLIGAGLLWVGWFGFNAGSSVESGMATARALTATQVAAAAGGLGWILIESIVHRKVTSLGIASGILTGLVAITPAAGVVRPGGAIVLGLAAASVCYGFMLIKSRLGYDDTLDVFGIHGVAGIVGALLLTPFIRESWLAAAATAAGGSWTAWQQLGVQVAGVVATVVYSAIVSLILFIVVQRTLGLRLKQEGEMAGLDLALHGEHGYGLLNLN